MDKKELFLMILNGLLIKLDKAPLSSVVASKLSINALFRRILAIVQGIWAERLFEYLNKYGVSLRECKLVALNQYYWGVEKLNEEGYDPSLNVGYFFNDIRDNSHAINIYNAYIRHCLSSYDNFCREIENEIGKETLTGKEMKILWSIRCREEYRECEKKCIILDKYGNRIVGGHFYNQWNLYKKIGELYG